MNSESDNKKRFDCLGELIAVDTATNTIKVKLNISTSGLQINDDVLISLWKYIPNISKEPSV